MVQTGIARSDYQAADRITRLCDKIAFDFCFEMPLADSVEIFADRAQQTTERVSYELTKTRTIVTDPWPLSVTSYQGYILAYQAEHYPHDLQPVRVNY